MQPETFRYNKSNTSLLVCPRNLLLYNSTSAMVARSVPWRRMCPERVASGVEEAVEATLYILHQTGPTGFVLKEERAKKKVKVYTYSMPV